MDNIQELNDSKVWPENFVVRTYQISSNMEDKAQKYVKNADDREKDLEDTWKITNQRKQKKQLELSQHYKVMAFVSSASLALSLGCAIASTAMQMNLDADQTNKLLADLLGKVGDNGTSFLSKTADNLSTSSTQNTNSLIEELTQNAQKIWEADKRSNETRKEELKNLKEKLNGAARDSVEKASLAYSVRG